MTDSGGAFARRSDPSTSHEAAERVNVTALEAEVEKVVRRYGPPHGPPMCVVEIAARLPHLSIDTVSPRPSQMVEKRLLECLGKQPRANRYGNIRMQLVYQVPQASAVAVAVTQTRAPQAPQAGSAAATVEEEIGTLFFGEPRRG